MLKSFKGTIIFVTHDRAFLKAVATSIIELDRGNISVWPGDYDNYLRRKEEVEHSEDLANARFDKKLNEEEKWIRQGIKARRTRNEGRVRALKDMREERMSRRERQGNASFSLQEGKRSGKIVAEVNGISFSYQGKKIVENFSSIIMRGDRIGIIGANGVGKTTLINLLLGKLEPQSGEVKLGTNLDIAYFDQHRAILNEEENVADNVADGKDHLMIEGQSRHVLGYLQDFLFVPQRARTPVKALSGGERNRLLLAKLFTRPFNLLVMDEPTNDLDVETLELLEELLEKYQGTLLLVSHDREFINNVVTHTYYLSGNGEIEEYVGGYDDMLRQRGQIDTAARQVPETKQVKTNTENALSENKNEKKKLSYKEQRELEMLPAEIERLEKEIATLSEKLSSPEIYKDGGDDVAEMSQSLESFERDLEKAFEQWEQLESIK